MYKLAVTYRPGRDWKYSFSTEKSVESTLPVMVAFRSVRGGVGHKPSISASCRRYSSRRLVQSWAVFTSARHRLEIASVSL